MFVTDVTQPRNHEMILSCARSICPIGLVHGNPSMSLTWVGTSRMSVASNVKIASKYFRTNDGVRLHYLEAGAGKPVVLVYGFSQNWGQIKFSIQSPGGR